MSGDIAAAGDFITGALAARSVEPHAGEGAHQGHGDLCLNCGTRLIGAHCHACGQSAHVHRTVGAIGHEIAHGVFHFEGKIWRTLPMLLLRPGDLTRRYVAGERARFVSPLALFLFTVFLMFATISALGGDIAEAVSPETMSRNVVGFARGAEKAQKALEKAEGQRVTLAAEGKPTQEVDREITALRTTIAALKKTQAGGTSDTEFKLAEAKTGWVALDHGLEKANKNPGLALYKLQTSTYKYSWLLIPISTPLVALLFLWRRRFGLYDHAIFVTYSLAFMMLMVIALMLLSVAGLSGGWMSLVVLLLPPVHMFRQLRGAYSLRKRSALWRTAVLLVFAWTALSMFLVLLTLHGLTD
ncbi:DUF3667 domain-containing protein [Sphingomonadaceae bacterium OTU29THOMA1]|uniref:DUF3667 domain-containing protein n=1 Tax=Sphingomonas sp. Leaf37 TaxID=2876552 RepID=UPI001E2D5DD4|nr:DUF3667 domain-containing protein [Sphingomonas sp. Leaf37]USU03751.1 DUF3667 domain-containing protein [Sphingomonadaceae bacterium OTU29LAMAA1]USU10994.1 DUF3667 domain-containing protein [Sphingomonadaceae bacterium OTU29THOMA1]